MEGKEYNSEDEERNSQSSNEDNQSDDFGLPSYGDKDSSDDNLGEPYSSGWDDEPKSDYNYGESSYDSDYSDDYSYDSSSSSSDSYGQEDSDYDQGSGEQESYYDSDDYGHNKSSSVGWIILIVVILIGLGLGGFWWWNNYQKSEKAVVLPPPKQPEVVTPDTSSTDMLAAEPEEINAGPVPGSGSVVEINQSTNRYYVIIASTIDDDLLMDYGKKLSKEGYTCKILAPKGKTKFYRFSIADYDGLNEATLKAEELKATYGQDVWVMRY